MPKAKIEKWWAPFIKKNGKPGKRWVLQFAYHTPIKTCELCGLVSHAGRVRERSDCYVVEWMAMGRFHAAILCCGCWNKVRPIIYERRLIQKNWELIRKLKREARKARTLYGDENR